MIFSSERVNTLCTPLEIEEPTSFQEAINSANHKEYIDSMREGMDSIKKIKV